MRKLPLLHWAIDDMPLRGNAQGDPGRWSGDRAMREKAEGLSSRLPGEATERARRPGHHMRLQVTKDGEFRQFPRRDARLVRRR